MAMMPIGSFIWEPDCVGISKDFDAQLFFTPDSQQWRLLWPGRIERFVDGKWKAAVSTEISLPSNLKPVGSQGPPWILLGQGWYASSLYALTPEGPGPAELIDLFPCRARVDVRDAIWWSEGQVLLATRKGLKFYWPADDRLAPVDFPLPLEQIRRLARDGAGRLWMAREKLWMLSADLQTLHVFETLPTPDNLLITAMTADPTNRYGIAAAIAYSGVLFISARPRADQVTPDQAGQ